MRSNRPNASRKVALAGVLALVAISAAVWAAPASAASASGSAVILTAKHDRGRTLSGQGGKLVAGEGTTLEDGKLTLPVPEVDPANSTAGHSGNLAFRKGSRGVALAGIHFNFTAGTLDGLLGGQEMAVFKLGGQANVNPVTGAVSLNEGELRLTADAAKVVRKKLGLKRALRHNGIGRIWVSAKADPAHAAARPVTSGGLNWGVLASWRAYVLGNFGPGSVGTITTEGGATSTGTLSAADAYFTFPATGGSYEEGLFGAADRLELKTAGSVIFAKPGHCIIEVKFSGIEVTLDGSDSSLTLDSVYDIDSPPTCTDNPAVTTNDVKFATLDLTGVTPARSADGSTITWANVPATLTAAGGAAWGAGYEAGEVLDPVTITAGLG